MAEEPIEIPTSGPLPGLTMLNDVNGALLSLATMFSGASAPTAAALGISSLAGIWWHDTANAIIWLRDQADTTWIKFAQIDEVSKLIIPAGGGVIGVNTSITLEAGQIGSYVEVTGGAGVVITLPQTSSALTGRITRFFNATTLAVALTASGGQVINWGVGDTATAQTLMPGASIALDTDGSSWSVDGMGPGNPTMVGDLTIAAGSDQYAVKIYAPNNVNGANIALFGNGTTTPNKFIRAMSGVLQFINSTYSAVLATLDDIGNFSATGNISAGGSVFGTTPGAGSSGGIVVKGAANGNPGYLQFVNAAANAEWGDIHANSSGDIGITTASGNPPLGNGYYLAFRPVSAGGLGQWQALTQSGGSCALPAGGSWAYFGSNNGGGFAGVAAGGTVVWTGSANNFFGFCWRIG